ncbi:asparagine synthase-related protein [Acidobacteriia bacterium AH_259_A11_L15]|nr:asparagine synthase-related protein [Acidobacteriia bacterium AH_259_A11_L15]
MSGIAGICGPEGSAAKEPLVKIRGALAHRDPDTLSVSLYDPRPAPPTFLGSYSVVADARLYNQQELGPSLLGSTEGGTDTELIARAYQRWGIDCLQHLDGDFAFVIWDPGRQRLFCARDPLGVRPFYYRWQGQRFVWASEVKALLADPDYSSAPDEAMVGEYVLGWSPFPDASATFYRGIRQLPAGHYLVLERGRLDIQRYWDIEPADEEARRHRTFEETVEAFRVLFERAVQQRLGSLDRLAVLVSGGLDSTSISSLVERIVRSNGIRRPSVFHLSYYALAPNADERGYLERFEEKYNCSVDYIAPKSFRVLEGVEQAVDLQEGPLLDSTWSVAQQWAAHLRLRDYRVGLTGFGGDNIFPESTAYCSEIWRKFGWQAGWKAVRRTARYYGLSPRVFLKPTLRSLVPERWRFTVKSWLGKEISPWVRPDFARRSGLLERVQQPIPRRGFSGLSQEMDYRHLSSGRLSLQLGYLDRIGAAHGLELRHPFLHPALVRLTLAAPLEHKLAHGETKLLLRHAMNGILPEVIRQRRDKGTLTQFVASWIRRHEAKSWQRLAQNLSLSSEYIQPGQVRGVVQRLLKGDDAALKPAWNLLALELWLRRNFGAHQGGEGGPRE